MHTPMQRKYATKVAHRRRTSRGKSVPCSIVHTGAGEVCHQSGASAFYAPLRSVLNACHWHTAPHEQGKRALPYLIAHADAGEICH